MKTALVFFALCPMLFAQETASLVSVADLANHLYVAGPGWVEKLAADHETVVWKTTFVTPVAALAVDSAGGLYAAGASASGGGFLAVFSNEGELLSNAPVDNPVTALALDATGAVYLAGPGYVAKPGVWSISPPGPVTALEVDPNGFVFAGGAGFVAKLTRDGARWEWTNWLTADPASTQVRALTLTGDGGIYASGQTRSPFLPMKDAQQALLHGPLDSFVMRLSSDGKLVWSTYVAPGGPEGADLLKLDPARMQTSAPTPQTVSARSLIPTTISVDGFFSSTTFGTVTPIRGTVSAAAATGKIAFYDGGIQLGVRSITNGLGWASMDTTNLAPGKHMLWVRYSGDGTYAASTSAKASYTVNTVTTTGFGAGPSISNSDPAFVTTFAYTPYSTQTTNFAAVVNQAANNVSVYKVNPATGVWSLFGTWSVHTGPSSVVAADLNGDGYPDLAVTSADGYISILLGAYDNNFNFSGFSLGVPINAGSNSVPVHVAAGDFNGDGLPDLAVVNSGTNTVSIFTGFGDGSFTLKSTLNVGTSPSFIAVTDFNGDGIADLAVANQLSNNVYTFLGNGDGTFTGWNTLTVGSHARGIAVGDFNGDGKPDLAISNFTNNTASIFLQNSAGTGFNQVADVTMPSGTNPWGIVATDFDGDGKADLVIAGWSTSLVYTYHGNGDGTFTAGPGSPFSVSSNPASMALGDFDGNGTVDIVASAQGGGSLSVLLGTSTVAKIATSITMTAASGASFTNSTYGANVNLTAVTSPTGLTGSITFYDGVNILTGLTVSSLAPGTHTLTARYSGDSTHSPSVSPGVTFTVTPVAEAGFVPEATAADNGAYFVAPATFNGQPGFVSVNRSANTVKAWTATSFTLYGSAATGNSPTAAAVADFNGDGNPDIAVTNSGDNTVTILLGNNSGVFTQAPGSPIAVGGQPQYVASGDFNGDGIVDLAVANFQSTSNSVTILLGYGDGTFYQAAGSPVAVGSNPWFVAVADFNGDGKADLVVSNGGSGNVTVLLGNGDGTFTAGLGSPLGVGSSARSIAVADFNGDGRPDIAVANYNDNTISILVQNSGGTGFTAKPNITLPAGTNPWTVVASDFNADGKLDLAVTGFTSNKVYVFLGNGDGTFTQAANSPVAAGSGATGLLVEDFNHDGRPDIAVADQNGNVTVLQGSVSVAVSLGSAPNPSRLGQAVSFSVAANPLPSTPAPFLILDGAVPVVAGNTGQVGIAGFSTTFLGTGARSLRTSVFNPSPFYLPAYAKTTQTVNANPVAGFRTSASGAGTAPQNAAVGDFNGDGIPDYATSDQNSNGISVYIGNGSGGFSQASGSPYADAHTPLWVVAGDFNNDGKQDLAVTNYDGSLTVLLGSGSGTFTAGPAGSSNAGTLPGSIVVGDFNNDGIEDLAVTNVSSAGTVTILLGDGTGKFTVSGTPVSVGAFPASVAISDFNGDGNADLVVSNGGETSISVLLGNGQGGFSSAKVNAPDGANALAVADFDGDGLPDVAVAGNTGITLFRGNGAGGFTPFPSGEFVAGTNNFPVAVMDFNGDGKPDIAYFANQSSLIVLLNTSSGPGSATFAAAPYSPIATPNGPNSLVAADLNGDGAPDLLMANTFNGVSVWLGAVQSGISLSASPNPATYGSAVTLTATVTPSNINSPVTFYDGVSVLGSAVSSGGTASLLTSQLGPGSHSLSAYFAGNSTTLPSSSNTVSQSVTLNSAAGSFVVSGSSPGIADAYEIVNADMNGDGKPDLVAVNRSANTVSVWLGNGTGGFTQSGSPVAVGSSPTSVAVADFNRDGRPDLAVTNSGSNNLTILLQNANGTFTAASGSPIAVGGQPQYVASGDFNGDGIPDLAVANFQSTSDNVTILLGNGDGTFRQASGSLIPVGTNPWFIAVADFNGDGKADLAVSNGSSNNVDVFLGNGDGTFTQWNVLTVGSSARSIATGYFNADTKLDIAVANYNTNTVSVFVQNSAGTGFTQMPDITLPSGTNPWTVVTGDFNGDGKADLAVAAFSGNQVFVYLGHGDGTFAAASGSPYATGSGPGSLAVGNFTGTGVESLAVANQNGTSVTILAGALTTTTSLTTNGNLMTVTVSPTPSGGKVTLYNGTQVFGVRTVVSGQVSFPIVGVLPAGVNSFQARFDGSGAYLPSLSAVATVTHTPTASSTFSALLSAPTTTGQTNIVQADINGDGKPDFVVVSAAANTVSILLNTGSGASRFTHAPGSPYSIGNRAVSFLNAVPTSVAVGDFNGDGRPDLAVTGSLDGSVTILLQNADGSFTSTWNNVPYIFGLVGVAAADFNNDGIADLAITRPGVLGQAGSLLIALGNGDGTFVFNQTSYSSVGNAPGVPAIADFNGDGNADAAVPNSDGTITILLGQGNGLMTPGFGGTLTAGAALTTLTVADLNGDGHPDLAAAGSKNGLVTVFLVNSAVTGFKTPTTVSLPNGANALGLAATDFNGDGVMDLAAFVSGTTGNYVTQLIGAGTGSFTAGPSAQTVFGAGPICVADWNGDGRMDFAAAPSNGPAIVVDGVVPFAMSFSVSPSSSALGNPVTLSVSPDGGIHGSATFYDGTNIIGSVPSLTTGNSISLTTTELPSGSHQLSAAWSGDENTPPQAFAPVAFSVAPGQYGALSPTQISVNGTYIYSGDSLASADVNRDGVLDLLVIHTGTNLVNVYLGSKAGTFSEAPGSPISVASPTFAASADFNGDGIPDLAILSSGGGYTVWFGDGTGRLTQSGGVRTTVDTHPNSIVVTDFNRDGRADIAITNYLDSSVSILLGDGAGNFGDAPGSPKKGSLIGPGPMAVADFNGDGNPDLVIASTAGNLPNNPMPIFYGSATGAMTAPNPNSVFQLAFLPTGIAVGDFNHDGIPDVAVAYTAFQDSGEGFLLNVHASLDAYLCCSSQQFFYSTLVEQGFYGQDGGDVDFFPEPYDQSSQPGNLVVLDYAGAGNADIATPVGMTIDASNPAYDALTVYLNKPASPTTSLYPPNLYPVVQTYTGSVGSGPTTPPTVISGDFNGDGLVDLIVSSPNNGTISFLPGTTLSSASQVAITTPPPTTGGVAGTPIQPVVAQVQDPFGRLITSSNATVTITSTPQNPSSGATATAVNGVATFNNLIFNTPGAYTITATSNGLNSSNGYPLTISGLPTQVVFSTAPPTSATRAVTLPQIVAQLKDANGNPVPESLAVTITSSPAGITGTTVVNANTTGAATFTNLSFSAPGTYTLTASAPGLTSVVSGTITVAPGPATQLGFNGAPSSALVTAPLPSFTAQVEDAGGFTVVTATGTVTLSSSPAGVSGTTTATLSSGVATFANVSFSMPGSYTLTATWSGGFSVQTSITMGTGPASKLLFTTQPPASTTAAATLSPVVVKVTDSLGDPITGSSASVTIASSPAGAVLGTLTVNAVNGVATFSNLYFNAAGAYTLTASSSGLTGATSTSIAITAGAANKLFFNTPPPVTATPGQTFSAVVQVQDSVGNVVMSSSAPVTMQSSPTGLGGTVTVNAVNGVATFNNLSIAAIGSYTLTATSPNLTPASSSISIGAGTPAKLAFTSQPTAVTLGQAFTASVQLQDAGGNAVTNWPNPVQLVVVSASQPGLGGVLGANTQAATATASFGNITINEPGTYTLTATLPSPFGLPTIATATSATITASSPVALSVSPASPGTFGRSVSLNAAVTPSSATGTVTFYDGGTPIGTASLMANGTASLTATLPGTGARRLRARYDGDANNRVSLSATTVYTVSPVSSLGPVALTPIPMQSVPQGQGRPAQLYAGSIATGDFNGDGKADLAILDPAFQTLTIWLGDGRGGYTVPASSPIGVGSGVNLLNCLAVADFNGDGIPDLAVGSSQNVFLLLGDGAGGFNAATGSPYSVGNTAVTMAVGDFNGDGRPDIAVADSTGVALLLGNSGGGLSQAANLSSVFAYGTALCGSLGTCSLTPGGATALAAADLNSDGISDLLLANNGKMTVLTGDGAGGFVLAGLASVDNYVTSLAVGDFNGDGKPDVAAAGYDTSSVQVFTGNGAGGLSASGGSIGLPAGPSQVLAVDMDGDGNTDLAIALASPQSTGYTAVYFLMGAGNGTFSQPSWKQVNLGTGGPQPWGIAALDFTGDGRTDIASLNAYAGAESVSIIKGTGVSGVPTQLVFTTQPPVAGNTGLVASAVVTVEDTNGDVVTNSTAPVTIVSNPSGVSGTLTANAVNGVATFTNLVFNIHGTYTLTASSPGLAVATSNSIMVIGSDKSANNPTQVAITTQPSTGTVGQAIGSVVVQVENNLGGLVTGSSAAVIITSSPAGVTGTLSANAASGVATFSNLVFPAAGSYTLTAASPGLSSAVSSAIVIGKATPTITWGQPAAILSGTALSSTQLNATASVPGTFVYTPAAGTVLPVGNSQTLSVLFTPTDTADYTTASAMVSINVNSAPAVVTSVGSSTANGTYGTGGSLSIAVTFSKPVIVTGTPRLALNSGGTATYSSGSGTAMLNFTYTVGAGQSSTRLDEASAAALTLNSGTIQDSGGTAAILALPAPGTAGSLGANSNIVINTAAAPVDVSSQVKVTTSGLTYSRASGAYTGTLTILNTGSSPIAAPLQSVFTNLIAGATLVGGTGTVPSGPYAGAPYITVPGSSALAPGASVTIPVKFTYTGTAAISYVSKTLSGGF